MPKPNARKPTYGAATRLARIAIELCTRPWGMSLDAIQRRFGISERTVQRYIAVCRRELVDFAGRPILEVIARGPRRYLRIHRSTNAPQSNAYQVASLYFMLTVFRFLKGTVIEEGAEDIWDRIYEAIPEANRPRLANLDRKFYSIAYAPKSYAQFDDLLDIVLRALVYQWRLRIDYAGLRGEGRTHEFDPYTMVAYRGGLYLFGMSRSFNLISSLAIERIRKAEPIAASDGQMQTFDYPSNYRPEKHLNGVFGLIDGPKTRVELLLLGSSEPLLRARTVHPTQQFRRRADGKTVMSMTVKGTTELSNWILSQGPWVEVLKPKALRDEVAARLAEAAALYEKQAPKRMRASHLRLVKS